MSSSPSPAAAAAAGADSGMDSSSNSDNEEVPMLVQAPRRSKSTRLEIPLAFRTAFMTPEPEDLPRRAVDSFLKQVDIQLEVSRSLADNICLDDALKLQRLVHERIKELSHLGDACIATWTNYNDEEDVSEEAMERKRMWMETAVLEPPVAEETLKETQLSRWTKEETDLFAIALTQVDLKKRGYPEEIRKIVKTRTVVQIRERLRRIKKRPAAAAAAAAAAAEILAEAEAKARAAAAAALDENNNNE